MTEYKILFVGNTPAVARAVRRSITSAGHRVQCSPLSPESVVAHTKTPQHMLIVDADVDDFDQLLAVIRAYRERCPDGIVLLLSAELGNRAIIDQIISSQLSNLVGKHAGITATPEHIDEPELITTVDKLLTRNIFGIQNYLYPRVQIHTEQVKASHERANAISSLKSFLRDIDCYRSLEPMIVTVADELLMNAVFSAPRDAEGNPKYAEIDRNASFPLEPREHVRFQFACDGRSVLLSVTDRFGSLDRDLVVKHLGYGFLRHKATVRKSGAGAGIGLYMIAHSITQLVFNIEKDKQTEVIASFYIRNGLRAFRGSGRSLNLFVLS